MKILPLATVCLLTLSPLQLRAQALSFPQTNEPVNDYAEVIPAESEVRMEALTRTLWEKTHTPLVVATFNDLGGENPRIFANKLYGAWRLGPKGILLLVAVKERLVTFETGERIKESITDLRVAEILDRHVVPLLRRDEYGEGLLNGMGAVAHEVALKAGVRVNVKRYAPHLDFGGSGGRMARWLLIALALTLGLAGKGLLTPYGSWQRPASRLAYVAGFGGGFGGFDSFGKIK